MKYFIFLIFFFNIDFDLNAQSNAPSKVFLKKGIVHSGYIFKWIDQPTLADPAPLLSIYSTSSEVFSIGEGCVTAVKDSELGYIIVIKNNDTAFSYSNLHSANCKIGETVHKGQMIGNMLKGDRESEFELVFMMMLMKSHDFLNVFEHF